MRRPGPVERDAWPRRARRCCPGRVHSADRSTGSGCRTGTEPGPLPPSRAAGDVGVTDPPVERVSLTVMPYAAASDTSWASLVVHSGFGVGSRGPTGRRWRGRYWRPGLPLWRGRRRLSRRRRRSTFRPPGRRRVVVDMPCCLDRGKPLGEPLHRLAEKLRVPRHLFAPTGTILDVACVLGRSSGPDGGLRQGVVMFWWATAVSVSARLPAGRRVGRSWFRIPGLLRPLPRR